MESDQQECTDQTTDQETADKVKEEVATDEGSKVASGERTKLERRKRRCPIVNVEKYLNNEDDKGEKKEDGAAASNRYRHSLQLLIATYELATYRACVWKKLATGFLRNSQKHISGMYVLQSITTYIPAVVFYSLNSYPQGYASMYSTPPHLLVFCRLGNN